MLIANPIYDVVFKRMLENERVARFFIGTLLNETITAVEVRPQEFTTIGAKEVLTVFRLDFIATVLTASGEAKKVLIEIQKAQHQIDIMRFRNYLGEQYRKREVINGHATPLPITTIYILGTNLPGIETPCLKVERGYRDMISQQPITAKSDFIEQLTHDSYVVQVERVTGRFQTRLEKLLSVFEQTNFIDDLKTVKEFLHEPDTEELRLITDILHHSGTNPAERKQIEIEQEAWRTFNAQIAEEKRSFEEKERAYNKAMAEMGEALNEKDQALSERDQALSEKDQALSEKDRYIQELLRKLKEKEE